MSCPVTRVGAFGKKVITLLAAACRWCTRVWRAAGEEPSGTVATVQASYCERDACVEEREIVMLRTGRMRVAYIDETSVPKWGRSGYRESGWRIELSA